MTTKAQIEITATDRTREAIRSAQQGLDRLNSSATSIGRSFAGLGGLLSVGALAGFARQAIDSAAALDDMAESTGASVEGLSRLTQIARIGGNDVGVIETALVRLTKALSGADEESKGAGAALAALGLSMDQLKRLSPDQALERVAQAFNRFEDGAGKTSAALALFGKSGAQLLPVLKDIAEDATTVGRVTAEQAAAAEKLGKEWGRLVVSAQTVANAVLLDLVPALNKYGEAVNAISGKAGINPLRALNSQFNADSIIPGANVDEKLANVRRMMADTDAWERRFPGGLVGTVIGIRGSTLRDAEAALQLMKQAEERAALNAAFPGAELTKPALPIIPTGGGSGGRGKDPGAEAARERARLLKADADGWIKAIDDQIEREKDLALAANDAAMADKRRLDQMLSAGPVAALDKQREQMQFLAKAFEDGRINAEQFSDAATGALDLVAKDGRDKFSELQDAINGWSRSAAQAVTDFAFGAKRDIGDMIQSVVQQFASMQIQQRIFDPLFASAGSFLSGLFHGGGVVGAEGGARAVSPLAFAGAPRFHGGGIMPGEYPAILQRGEGVFTPAQMRALGGRGNVQVIVNNNAPGIRADATEREQGDTRIIEVVVEQVSSMLGRDIRRGRGAVAGAMESTYGLNRVAGAMR